MFTTNNAEFKFGSLSVGIYPFIKALKRLIFSGSINIPYLKDSSSPALLAALQDYGCAFVGTAKLPSVLVINWNVLLMNYNTLKFKHSLTVPLIAWFSDVLAGHYPVLERLLYSSLASILGKVSHPKSEFPHLEVRTDTTKLTVYEDALISYYLHKAATNTGLVKSLKKEIDSVLSIAALNSIPLLYSAAELKHLTTDHLTILDVTKFIHQSSADKERLRTVVPFGSDVVLYPNIVGDNSIVTELNQLKMYAPVEDPLWCSSFCPNVSPTSTLEEQKTQAKLEAMRQGIVVSHIHNWMVISLRRVAPMRLFTRNNPYSLFAPYAFNSELHKESTYTQTIPLSGIKKLCTTLGSKYPQLIHTNSLYFETQILPLLKSSQLWNDSDFDTSFYVDLTNLESKLKVRTTKFRNAPKQLGMPSGFDPTKDGRVLPPKYFKGLRVPYTNAQSNLPPNTISMNIILYRSTLYFKLDEFFIDNTFLYSDPNTLKAGVLINSRTKEAWLTIPTLRLLLESRSYVGPTISDIEYFITICSTIPHRRAAFTKYSRCYSTVAPPAKWTKEQDQFILDYVRPNMSVGIREQLAILCENHTQQAIVTRVNKLRQELLKRGITDISKYPRFRCIPALNDQIHKVRLQKNKDIKG
jgi:hypothetical protein